MRVVELGNLVAAPYAGMLLADLGADVIKVEPLAGDLAREIGPFQNGESLLFMAVNRGKRSVVADLRSGEGRRHAFDLGRAAHVVLHNLRRGAMERSGLDYQALVAVNPTLVYCSIAAFGADGPYADRAGIDVIFQGESGMLTLNGDPGAPPQKTATTIGDFLAGTNAALAICAALAGGRGGRIDVSLRDGLIAVQAGWNALFFAGGLHPERTGTASPFLAPNQVFETADGYLTLAVVSDRHYQILCETLGLTVDHPSNEGRMAHRAEVASRLEAVLTGDTTEAWVTRLSAAGLPAGRVLTLPEVFADPQALYHRMAVELDHPAAGRIRVSGSPIRLDGTPALTELPPPTLGAHTAEVLAEIGLTP